VLGLLHATAEVALTTITTNAGNFAIGFII
jgi:hypothetical protein